MHSLSLWCHPWTGQERIYVSGQSDQIFWFERRSEHPARDWALCSEQPCSRDGHSSVPTHDGLELDLAGKKLKDLSFDELREVALRQKGFCEPH